MSKTTTAVEAVEVAVGDVVIYRDIYGTDDGAPLVFVPAIVRNVGEDGTADLTVFGESGRVCYTHDAARYSKADEWPAWYKLADHAAARPQAAVLLAVAGSQPKSMPEIAVGSFVIMRHAERDPNDRGGGAMGFASNTFESPAIVRGIDADGRLRLTVFTKTGVIDAGPRPYHRDHAGCWYAASKNSQADVSIVNYRVPIDTGRPAVDAIDNASGVAPVRPAFILGMDSDFKVTALAVLTDAGVVNVVPHKMDPDAAGCWFRR